jgi:hypothetical protein
MSMDEVMPILYIEGHCFQVLEVVAMLIKDGAEP